MTTPARSEIPVRITVRQTPAGVAFAVQRGRDELLEASHRSADTLVFEFTVGVASASSDKPASLRGPYVQGPLEARFIYLTSGTRAGQADTAWNRRAKLPLDTVTSDMIIAALRSPEARLETEVDGTADDGGPIFATIKSAVWRLAR